MKTYIKLFTALIFTFGLAIGTTSCSDDDYSLGDYWENIVTVNKIGDNTYSFTLDNGKELWVAAPAGLNLKPKYERAIINYTILSDKQGDFDHYIRLNGFYDVLTKLPVYIADDDAVKQDSIGNDPVKVHSIWEGGNYLNISFGYDAGGVYAHMLNLVSNQEDLSAENDVVKLVFRHNQKKDPSNYPIDGYVSFDLKPYMKEGRDKITFEISWKDFGGEIKTKSIEYNYKGESMVLTDKSENVTLNKDTNLNIY